MPQTRGFYIVPVWPWSPQLHSIPDLYRQFHCTIWPHWPNSIALQVICFASYSSVVWSWGLFGWQGFISMKEIGLENKHKNFQVWSRNTPPMTDFEVVKHAHSMGTELRLGLHLMHVGLRSTSLQLVLFLSFHVVHMITI